MVRNHSLIPSVLIFCFVSCSEQEISKVEPPSSVAIRFVTEDCVHHSTRGQNPLTTANMTIMGVFAGYEEENETFGESSVANDFINNVQYYRDHAGQDFAGANVTYWPFVGKLSFFAYAPWVAGTNLYVPDSYTSGFLKFHFKQLEDVTNQVDLCIAQPVLDQPQVNTAIPLHFNHALSQVAFSAAYTGELPTASLYVKINKIVLNGIVGEKELTVQSESPFYVWDAEEPEERISYTLDRIIDYPHIAANVRLPYIDNEADVIVENFINITTDNGRLYPIPQHVTGASMTVTYGVYEDASGLDVLRGSSTTTCDLPEILWEPTQCYRYRFTIDVTNNTIVNPTVSIVEWEPAVDDHGDNPIHL